MKATTVTIPNNIQAGQDLIAIPRQQYEKLLQIQAETEDALGKIERGNQDLRNGKAQTINSVAELM